MCERCGILVSRVEIVGIAFRGAFGSECLKPHGHDGPHLILSYSGEYIFWEDDLNCDCESCQSEDPTDWCLLYGEVSREEAEKLIASATYEGNE